MATYRQGTVKFTNSSKVVTGSNAAFQTDGVVAGDVICLVDGNGLQSGYLYEISSVDSDTQLTLLQNYQAATAGGASYMILNMAGNQSVPNFAARLARYYATIQQVLDAVDADPKPGGIPQADVSGKLDLNWLVHNTANGLLRLDGNGKAPAIHLPQATESAAGIARLASVAEAKTGTDTDKAVTAAGVKAAILDIVNAKFAAFAIKGEYAATTAYAPGDVATYGGGIYLCIAAATDKTPGATGSGAYWEDFTIHVTTYNITEGDPA